MNLEFRGVVLDFFTKQAYPDTRVILETGNGIDALNGYTFAGSQIDSVRTNSKGQYSFFEDSANRNIYRMDVRKQGYLLVKNPLIIAKIVAPGVNTDTLLIGRSAKVIFSAFNNNPGDGDEITITFHYNYPGSIIDQKEILNPNDISGLGLDPENFSIEREYFFDVNPTIKIDVRTMKIVQGDPVYHNETFEFELSASMTKTVYYEY